MLKITNTQPGPRGLNTKDGPVLVDPGQTVEAEVYEREKPHLEASKWFDIKGSYTANPDAPPAQAQPDTAALERAEKAAADAEKALADKDAEIEVLKKQLASKGK
jgi:hypothetical protein